MKSCRPIRWAPRVSMDAIKRLYEMDASRIIDEALVDDVGMSLLIRCEAIQRVTERRCPECGEILRDPGPPTNADRRISCPKCTWRGAWREYHKSYKGKRIHGGRAYPAFIEYLRDYPTCRTARDKILCIDRLVHAIHLSVDKVFTSPAAQNVIEGTLTEVRQFLDSLAYGDESRRARPGVRESYEKAMQAGDAATAEWARRKGIPDREEERGCGSPGTDG